jgi:hypothetical protein
MVHQRDGDRKQGGRGVTEQGDFFGAAQLGFELEDTHSDPTKVDPVEVREELGAILALARAASDTAPWDQRTHRYHQVVFPQMANWLPADEADALRYQFSIELNRIAKLLEAA